MPQEAEYEAITVAPGSLPFVVDYDGLTAALFQRSHEPAFDDSAAGMQDARQWADELIATYVSKARPHLGAAKREERTGIFHHDTGITIWYEDPDEARKVAKEHGLTLEHRTTITHLEKA